MTCYVTQNAQPQASPYDIDSLVIQIDNYWQCRTRSYALHRPGRLLASICSAKGQFGSIPNTKLLLFLEGRPHHAVTHSE